MLLLGAGIESTSHMISSMFYSLLYDDATLYKQLREDPGLVPNTVEETLRYRFQISKRHRTVKQDNNLLGVQLKKGDLVIAWMSAANMDEHMFERPFELDIHRKNNKRNLTFGIGSYFCLGAPLARLELNIALTAYKLYRREMSEKVRRSKKVKNLEKKIYFGITGHIAKISFIFVFLAF